MPDKYKLKQPTTGFSNDTVLCIDASISGMYIIYQPAILEERAIAELRQIAYHSAIRTREFNRSHGLGGTGSILTMIYDFYQNHEVYFSLITKVPGLLKVGKTIVLKSVDFYYWMIDLQYKMSAKTYSKPSMLVTLAWNIDARSEDNYTNIDSLKNAYIESQYVIKQFEKKLMEEFPGLKFCFFLKYKSNQTGMRLTIGRYRTSNSMEAKVFNKFKHFKRGDRSFRVDTITSHLLRIKRLKHQRNFVDIVDAYGFD